MLKKKGQTSSIEILHPVPTGALHWRVVQPKPRLKTGNGRNTEQPLRSAAETDPASRKQYM